MQQPVSQSVLQPVHMGHHEYSVLEKKMLHLLFQVHVSHLFFFVKAKNFSGPTIPFYLSYNHVTVSLYSLIWFG